MCIEVMHGYIHLCITQIYHLRGKNIQNIEKNKSLHLFIALVITNSFILFAVDKTKKYIEPFKGIGP